MFLMWRFRVYLAAELPTMSTLALVTCVVIAFVNCGPRVAPLTFLASVLLMALLGVARTPQRSRLCDHS